MASFDKTQDKEETMNDKKEEKMGECCGSKHQKNYYRGGGNAWGWTYFLGIIGTAIYFIQQVSGFWPVVLAILKALVWPAFLLYKVFQLLQM